jgi:hypothetical protein
MVRGWQWIREGVGTGDVPATPRSPNWNADEEVPSRRRGAMAARKEAVKCMLV